MPTAGSAKISSSVTTWRVSPASGPGWWPIAPSQPSPRTRTREQLVAEHVVKRLTWRGGSRACCLSCGWLGELRRADDQASHDAALHADRMARQGEGVTG